MTAKTTSTIKNQSEKLWTVFELAREANTSKDCVVQNIHRGDLQAQRIGRMFVIQDSRALAWLEFRQRRASSEKCGGNK